MSDDEPTKPTIETVLERLTAFEERVNARIGASEERVSIRLDRIESVASTTRGEMLDLRADFRELRGQLREHFPALS